MEYLLAKNLKGVSDHLEIWHVISCWGGLKKTENNVVAPGPLHCENEFYNMKIFAFFCALSKYLKHCFDASGQLVPKSEEGT